MAKNKDVKLAQDFTGIGQEKVSLILNKIAQGKYSNGLFGTELIEPVPNYHKAGSEIINFDKTGPAAAQNNCWIILGRDRVDEISSGYGGKGHTQAGAIYICAGMNSAAPYEEQPPQPAERSTVMSARPGMPKDPDYQGSKLATVRSFTADASFIYLSQKCSIDDYLNLGGRTVDASLNPAEYVTQGNTADVLKMTKYNTKKAENPRSGIGIKSDNVRVVGRESIRLQIQSEAHSQGNYSEASYGISLIGGGDATQTQPMVKGYNLIGSYEHLKEAIDTLSLCVSQFITDQTIWNQINASHVHIGFGGQPSTDIIAPQRAQLESMALKTFSISYDHLIKHSLKMSTFLADFTKPGTNYILSHNVFCD